MDKRRPREIRPPHRRDRRRKGRARRQRRGPDCRHLPTGRRRRGSPAAPQHARPLVGGPKSRSSPYG